MNRSDEKTPYLDRKRLLLPVISLFDTIITCPEKICNYRILKFT